MRLRWIAPAAALPAMACVLAVPAQAGEGMWTPAQVPAQAAQLRQAGLRMDPASLARFDGDPLGAVVSLGNCSGGVVSPQGLIATNHHCVFALIQSNSSPGHDLLANGFAAPGQSAELPGGPQSRVYVPDRVEDVTDRIRAAIASARTPAARTAAVESVEHALVTRCEGSGGYRCRLYSFAGGNAYQLVRSLEIRDVRLVYAPPNAVGNFGGESDNWSWPRQAGDFAFVRAYVGRDGKPAEYSRNNVPYQPRVWLKFSETPLSEGDFVMSAGFPAATNRDGLADEFRNTAEWLYPTIIRDFRSLSSLVQERTRGDASAAARYAATLRGWSNTLKSLQAQSEGFTRSHALDAKQDEERAALAWLKSQRRSGRPALDAYATIQRLNEDARRTRDQELVLGQTGGALGTAAVTLYRYAIERAKPDAQREAGFQPGDASGIQAAMQNLDRRYDQGVDSAVQRYWLDRYARLPRSQHVAALDAWLGGGNGSALDAAVARTHQSALKDAAARAQWLKADKAAFEASDDPAIRYAVAVMPTLLAAEAQATQRAGDMLAARPVYLKAVEDYRASKGRAVYPDANGSLRLVFGHVTGYVDARRAKQPAFTTLEQVAARSGPAPFDTPRSLLDAIASRRQGGLDDAKLGTVPVDFLSDLDVTAGSSGSPVLDADGRIVGLAFDANREAVASNWVFDPAMTRTIAVDQRYMHWVMQEGFPAPAVLRELGWTVPETSAAAKSATPPSRSRRRHR